MRDVKKATYKETKTTYSITVLMNMADTAPAQAAVWKKIDSAPVNASGLESNRVQTHKTYRVSC
jgi:hypothetical protein